MLDLIQTKVILKRSQEMENNTVIVYLAFTDKKPFVVT